MKFGEFAKEVHQNAVDHGWSGITAANVSLTVTDIPATRKTRTIA